MLDPRKSAIPRYENIDIHAYYIFFSGIWLVFDPVLSQGGKKPPPPPTYSTDLEVALREELFITNNYSVLQRPSQKVFVKVSLTVLTVNDLVCI